MPSSGLRARRHHPRIPALAGLVLLAASLIGCAPAAPDSGLFAGPDVTAPPAAVTASGNVKPGTVRLLGSDDSGVEYYVLQTVPDSQTCMVLLFPDGDAVSGCGGLLPVKLSYNGVHAVLHDEVVPPTGGAQVIGEYLHVVHAAIG